MPAIITHIIPPSSYEICRDALGAILLIELTNQKTLNEDPELEVNAFPEEIEGQILLESMIPTDAVNEITINILPDTGEYVEQSQSQATGMYRYFIDIHSSGISSTDSATRRDKFMRMCMYIFRSAQYRQLGLPLQSGIIGGVYVEKFMVQDPHKRKDSDYTSFARIHVMVRAQEIADVWEGVALEINNTKVKLENTEKGYIFVFDN
jgi:hypothetical protein